MKKILQKYDTLFVILFFMIVITGRMLFIKLDSADELWNFSNIYKMVNGFTIYQDTNVIITPLFFYIGELFLKILGETFLTFKCYGIIINTIFFVLIYHLFRKLSIQKGLCFLYTIGIFIGYESSIPGRGASYNILALIFCLIGILQQIKQTKCNTILQGIIIFIITMTKQNIGLFYFLGLVLYELIVDSQVKDKIKHILIYVIVVGILSVGFLLSLAIQGNLQSFINYTILGITEFATRNLVITIWSNIILLIGIAVLLGYILVKTKRKSKLLEREKNSIFLLCSMGILLLGISYPIFNDAHTILASTVGVIAIMFALTPLLQEFYDKWKKTIVIITIIISLLIVGKSFYYLYQYNRLIQESNYNFINNNIYKGLIISEELEKSINRVTSYIIEENRKQVEVKILSHRANLYMNILKQNNNKMDLPFLGNLGKDGEDGLIREIQQLKNTKILLVRDEKLLYQESKKVRKYIEEELEKTGQIDKFDIYEVVE